MLIGLDAVITTWSTPSRKSGSELGTDLTLCSALIIPVCVGRSRQAGRQAGKHITSKLRLLKCLRALVLKITVSAACMKALAAKLADGSMLAGLDQGLLSA